MVQKQNDRHICDLNLKFSPKALGSQNESLGGEVNPETSIDFLGYIVRTHVVSFFVTMAGKTSTV